MSDILKVLVEMGFDQAKSELAIKKTGAQDVQVAMEWLLANPDLEVETTPSTSEQTEAEATSESEQPGAEAKSIKCEECGKLFKSHLEVEFHAVKSGHSNFSESTEEKKPLTEEEKQAQKARLEELMQQKRREREEKEKRDALEREKLRIRSGKELTEARKKQEEIEIKKLVDQRKKEKLEEKMARQRIKEQIEQDKLARKIKFGQIEEPAAAPQVTAQSPPPAAIPQPTNKKYSEAKLQIRLTNGSALTHTFGAKEPLSAVRLYIEMNRTDAQGPFSLMTSFPRKTFADEDYDKPLEVLGLAPSAVIIVTKC